MNVKFSQSVPIETFKMAEKLPSETRPPRTIRVCTVCKEYVKDKMYRSLESQPSETYRKYITEIGIPATGHACYPCVSKLNRLVKIDRDLATLVDKLKQKRVHLMCELKMLSTGMDHVDANFTSNILGMAPVTPRLEPPPPKRKKDDEDISTAHFSHILPKKQPVLVIQNPVPKLPQTVSLGKAPVILKTFPGTNSDPVPQTGKTKTQVSKRPLQPIRPVGGLVSQQGKSMTRPIQPAKQGVDLVLHTETHNNHQVSHQPKKSAIKELPKILPRPLQVSLGSAVLSNVIIQTGVPVSLDLSAVQSGVVVQPSIHGPQMSEMGSSLQGSCSDVADGLSTDDVSSQQCLPPISNKPECLNFEHLNHSQQCQTQEEVYLKNGFERIVTDSGDEYSIVKQEFSDSESSDTDVPGSEVDENIGVTDDDESLSQSFVVKQEPQEEGQPSVERVFTGYQEHVKHSSVTSDRCVSLSQSVVIKQEILSVCGTPEEQVREGEVYCDNHVNQTRDTNDRCMPVSQSVVIKQELLSTFDTPEKQVPEGGAYCDDRVKQTRDTSDGDRLVSKDVIIKQELHSSCDSPEEHVPEGGIYSDNHLKQTRDTSDGDRSISMDVVIKGEQHSAYNTPVEHTSNSNREERLEHSDEVKSHLSLSQSGVFIKREPPDDNDTLENVISTNSDSVGRVSAFSF